MSQETTTEAGAAPGRVAMRGAHLRLTPGETPALEGSRCSNCGDTFYPPRHICLGCYHEGLDRVPLSSRGKLWTFTIARMTLPGSLVSAPYVIAQVELPEGVMVATVLTGVDPEAVRIGMALELAVEKASVNAEGAEVMTFKFRPAEGGPA